jgi:ATPase subunit of ABC transporter with duplicated ATPase domains
MNDMPQSRPQVDPDTILREQQKMEYERAREQDMIKQIEE